MSIVNMWSNNLGDCKKIFIKNLVVKDIASIKQKYFQKGV